MVLNGVEYVSSKRFKIGLEMIFPLDQCIDSKTAAIN